MTTNFRHNSGDDFQSKWDVYAECLIRIQANERFVNYSLIEVEEATDMDADDEYTQKKGIPQEILDKQIQILPLIEEQIENNKTALQEELVSKQIAAQKVYSNHQALENEKKLNEEQMQEIRK